jgi:pimeloyl-ACP methyl ester carboxylesterase
MTATSIPPDWRAVDWPAALHSVDVDGARVAFVDLGSGEPPVLFVHGLGGQWRVWARNLPVIAQRRRARSGPSCATPWR